MTEHSKIPLPPESKGKSLFERAEELFGVDGFAPPPVPGGLTEPAAKRASRKGVSGALGSFEAGSQPAGSTAPQAESAHELKSSVCPEERGPDLVERPSLSMDPSKPPQPTVAEPPTQSDLEAVTFTSAGQKIDRRRLAELGLIQPEGKVTALLEEFRIVKRQVLLAARAARRGGGGAAAQRVLVCSPLPGEGKTFCATNLALAIAAEKDSEVLLVDADFAKPSVLSTLGLTGGRGLMDALADPAIRVEDCVIATDVPGLFVLPAGHATTSDSEYLASSRTPEVLERLTQGAPNRMVIFDSPPALAATPAAELAKHVGQALVVVRADVTGQSALEDALTQLATCPDIKLLLNAAHFSPSGRRFGTYYGYGD